LSIGTPARRNVRRIDTDDLKKSMIPIATQKYFFLRVGGNVCNSAFVKNMQVGATVLPIPKKTDRVAEDKCIQCDACVNDCPTRIISRNGSVPEILPEFEEQCMRCQHCLAVCPTGAISIFRLKPEVSLPLAAGVFPTREQMKTLVRGRRSVRKFRRENVPRELIDSLLADLVHAPTGCNDCDLIFTVVDDRREIEQLLEQIVSLAENTAIVNDQEFGPEFIRAAVESYRYDKTDFFFRGAPHLLLVSHGTKAHCGQEDSVLALAYFELLAQTAGLGTT